MPLTVLSYQEEDPLVKKYVEQVTKENGKSDFNDVKHRVKFGYLLIEDRRKGN